MASADLRADIRVDAIDGNGASEVPAPESVPPVNNPEPRPEDSKPPMPPASDEDGRKIVPMDLPGQPHAPERV